MTELIGYMWDFVTGDIIKTIKSVPAMTLLKAGIRYRHVLSKRSTYII